MWNAFSTVKLQNHREKPLVYHNNFKKSEEWLASIPETIRSWQKNLVS